MTKIFISFRNGDESFAAVTLDDRLSARFGPESVFRSSRSIPAGTDFEPVLWRSLGLCSVVLVVIGPHWLTGRAGNNRLWDHEDFVRREVALALRLGLTTIPVLVGGAHMPGLGELPAELAPLTSRQYRRIDARSADADVRALVEEVARVVGDTGPAAASASTVEPEARPQGNNQRFRTGNAVQARDVHGDLVMGDKVDGPKIVFGPGGRA